MTMAICITCLLPRVEVVIDIIYLGSTTCLSHFGVLVVGLLTIVILKCNVLCCASMLVNTCCISALNVLHNEMIIFIAYYMATAEA